jgi:hypothetical protein
MKDEERSITFWLKETDGSGKGGKALKRGAWSLLNTIK